MRKNLKSKSTKRVSKALNKSKKTQKKQKLSSKKRMFNMKGGCVYIITVIGTVRKTQSIGRFGAPYLKHEELGSHIDVGGVRFIRFLIKNVKTLTNNMIVVTNSEGKEIAYLNFKGTLSGLPDGVSKETPSTLESFLINKGAGQYFANIMNYEGEGNCSGFDDPQAGNNGNNGNTEPQVDNNGNNGNNGSNPSHSSRLSRSSRRTAFRGTKAQRSTATATIQE